MITAFPRNSSQSKETKDTAKMMIRRILTFGKRLLFFGVPVVLVFVGVIVWHLAFLFVAIEPEEVSPFRILLWTCVRDLEKEPPETIERLLDRIEETVGRSSGEMLDLNGIDLVTRVARKITTRELERRRREVAEYTLFAAASGQEEAAKRNDEILAGKPLAERNIFYLIKCQFIREMDRHETASSELEKQVVIQSFVEDLKWWRQFSENLYQACEAPPLSLIEMAKEYEMAFEYYRKNTDPETYRRMLAFRDKLQVAAVVSETKSRINQFLGPIWGNQ